MQWERVTMFAGIGEINYMTKVFDLLFEVLDGHSTLGRKI
jgi:hypothetical protein